MDEATRKYLSETGQSETRHLLCVECEHRIQFLPSAEGMEGLCPKCGTSQTLAHSTSLDSLDKSEVQDKPEAKSTPDTLFIPFIRGTSASMSEQFVDHGGRTGGSAAGGIANDLTATVEKYEAKGYEFQKIETIHVDVSPGCIGALMGKGKEYHPYDYLVFKKTSEPVRGQSA